jgi:hypothetical protein
VIGEFFEGKGSSEGTGLFVAGDSSMAGEDMMILSDGGVEDVEESSADGDVTVGLDKDQAIFFVGFFVFFVVGGDSSLVASSEARSGIAG